MPSRRYVIQLSPNIAIFAIIIFLKWLSLAGTVVGADSSPTTTRFCRAGEHVSGRWVPDENPTKSFLCCGWDQETQHLLNDTICPPEPQRNGQCIPMRRGAQPGLLLHSGTVINSRMSNTKQKRTNSIYDFQVVIHVGVISHTGSIVRVPGRGISGNQTPVHFFHGTPLSSVSCWETAPFFS